MVWSRGSTLDHHTGIQWCWEAHVLHTDKMLPPCIRDVPPLLPCPCWVLMLNKEMTQCHSTFSPACPQRHNQSSMGCSHSLPSSCWCLIFVLPYWQKHRIKISWASSKNDAESYFLAQVCPVWALGSHGRDGCHAPGVPWSSECGASWRHCQTPCSATGSKEKTTSNLSVVS